MSVHTDATASAILTNIASGLGYQCWHKFKAAQITPADLRVRLRAAGLTIDADRVKDINAESALKRAVREFRVMESSETDSGRHPVRAEVVSTTDYEIRIGLLRHHRVAHDEVSKLQTESVVYDRYTQQVMCGSDSSLAAHALVDKIQQRMTYLDGNDIRQYVVDPMLDRTGSFNIKQGVYYIPKDGADDLANTQSVISGIDNFTLVCGGIPAGSGWEQPLGDEARESLTNDLEELLKQIEGWETMARRVSSSSEASVMDRFTELNMRAAAYESALSVQLDDLRDRMEQMHDRARDAIQDREAEAQERESTRNVAPKAPDPADGIRSKVVEMSDDEVAQNLMLLGIESTDDARESLVNALLGMVA